MDRLPERLESERLIIRLPRESDHLDLFQAVDESRPELTKWVAWAGQDFTMAQAEFVCRRSVANFYLNTDLIVLFLLKDSGAIVGGSGLHKPCWDTRRFEIGYWGRTSYSGKGLITEGVQSLVAYAEAELKANRVFLTTDALNFRSRALAERLGFKLEGIMRQECLNMFGKLRDTCMYARVQEPRVCNRMSFFSHSESSNVP